MFIFKSEASQSFLTTAILALALCTPSPILATVTAGGDASVWDSAVPDTATLFPVGGSGQVNGEFILDTVEFDGSAIQVGLRAQERFVGTTLTRVGTVYFADTGTSGGGTGATWNYDLHLDFGTSDTDTTVAGGSLESQVLATLTPLNLFDFDVDFLLDTDPSAATSFVVNDLDEDLATAGEGPDLRLFQTSLNMLFDVFGGAGAFDPNAPGVYDFQLRVSDPDDGSVIARSVMRVVVGATDTDTLDIAVSQAESLDPVIIATGSPGSLTYTLMVSNLSATIAATGVEVSEMLTLPAGVTVSSGPLVSAGSLSGVSPAYTWTVGALAAGASETLTVELTVDPSTALGSDVIASSAAVTLVDQPDSNLFNDSSTITTSVACDDADGDGVCDADDNCPADANPGQSDFDGDDIGDACDLCIGDNTTGDTDGDGFCDNVDDCTGNDLTGDGDLDGICADLDCDDADPLNVCPIFSDDFETGTLDAWALIFGP